MSSRRMSIAVLVAALGALTLGVSASLPVLAESAASGATDTEVERHCVVEVVDEVGGVLITGPERCFDTFEEARNFGSAQTPGVTSSSNTIGLHFTGLWYSGSSIRIVGTTCSGGIWPASGSWNNNIESSYHYCGSKPTTFFNYSNCTNDARPITSDSPTLYEMNNRTSCVKYG